MSNVFDVSNISATITVLEGINATVSVSETINAEITVPTFLNADYYYGSYEVTPLVGAETVLETQGKVMTDDITVLEIPYYETSNTSGYTVYIGN